MLCSQPPHDRSLGNNTKAHDRAFFRALRVVSWIVCATFLSYGACGLGRAASVSSTSTTLPPRNSLRRTFCPTSVLRPR